VDNYFPGIVKAEITTWDEGAISWASVNKLKAGTAVQVFLEDLDQWVPVMINGAAVIAFAFLVFYPWLRG
jgi:hypothetical protein